MKKFLSIGIFVISFFLVSPISAQNLIGDSKSEVIEYYKNKYPQLKPDWTKSAEGTDVVIFHKNEGSNAYYFETGNCIAVRNIYFSYNDLSPIITALNKNFTPYEDNVWIWHLKDMDYQYKIVKTEDFFYVDIVIAKIH